MQVTAYQTRVLFVSVLIIAICGLIYELVISTLSSYLFGNSVTHFSIVIGMFLSAMGLGSYASRWIKRSELKAFILVELSIGFVGGGAAALLYAVFATTDYYYLAMIACILFIGGCIGMEIPLLTRMVGGYQALSESLANVLAFDYIGALIGSILFPIILLPQLGLLQTSFVVGLLNVGVVGLNLWVFRQELSEFRSLRLLVTGVALFLLGGTVWSGQLTSFLERQLYRDEIIYADQTPYQRIIITRWRDDIRLFLDGNLQFSTQDEYRYHEALTHPAMSLSRSRESILILGGGDGLIARELVKYDDVNRIVLVDIDPAITTLGLTHPAMLAANLDSLSDSRVELIHQDAYKYLEQSSELFGVIIIDLPDPNNESLGKLYSREFYRLVQRHLARGGVVASQATSPYFVRNAYWSIVHTATSVGWHTYAYHFYIPTFGDWGFFLASDYPLNSTSFAPLVPMRYLTPSLFQSSFLFDADIDAVETEINVLDSQVLLRYYQQGWRQWR